MASLLVIDLTVTPAGMDDESSSALAVGTGAIPSVIFAPVFIAVVALVAFVTRHQDRFQLRFVLEEEEEELEGESTSEGVTMTDSYGLASSRSAPCTSLRASRGASSRSPS